MTGNDYMIKFFNLISVIALSISNVACAKNNEVLCNTNNVEKILQCIQKENISLKGKLDSLKNDYLIWKKDVEKKCRKEM